MTRPLLAIGLLLALALGAVFALERGRAPAPAGSGPAAKAGVRPRPVTGPDGLDVRLSEAEPRDHGPEDGARQVEGEPLSARELEALLARLPPLPDAAPESPGLPVETLRPPRAGGVARAPFPPQSAAVAPSPHGPGRLQVLRRQPTETDAPIVPLVSVTFSEPMVALATRADLQGMRLPVRLTPEAPGRWRWLGTRLLVFEPEGGRMPAATRWEVTVPAGVKAAAGAALDESVAWSFTTPPPRLERSHPTTPSAPLRPVFVLVFDQRVDPAEVLRATTVTAAGKPLRMRLALEEEIEADREARDAYRGALPGRAVALVAEKELPRATEIRVEVAEGMGSAEGPLRTTEAQRFSFSTYGPLRVTGHGCSWGEQCPPESQWNVQLSNELEPGQDWTALVSVQPDVADLAVEAWGNTLTISGRFRANTTYAVEVDAKLRDVHGQTLERDASVTIRVGPATPSLWSGGDVMVVSSADGPRTYSVFSRGHSELKVALHAVRPEDWVQFRDRAWDRGPDKRTPPGRLVLTQSVRIEDPDDMTESRIDLAPALRDGLGHVIVVVEPAQRRRDDWSVVQTWVQVTRLGLDAMVDRDQVLGWVTALADGQPLANVKVETSMGQQSAVTDSDGLARLPSPPGQATLIARSGEDSTFLGWLPEAGGTESTLRWMTFDDRGLYRPGETARVKGFVRRVDERVDGDLALVPGLREVRWKAMDPQGQEVAAGTAPVSDLGGFDFSVSLPRGMNLGHAAIQLLAGGGAFEGVDHVHVLQVQEFRRPEFEVAIQADGAPFFVGTATDLSVSARYLAGGALPGAAVDWRVSSSVASFHPPGWEDFTFGRWIPWWMPFEGIHLMRTSSRGIAPWPPGGEEHAVLHSGITDASGEHRVRAEFLAARPPLAHSVTAEASVQDVNRQAFADRTTFLVHPATLVAGLRVPRSFVQEGERLAVEVVVTDLDGKAVPGQRVALSAGRARRGVPLRNAQGEETLENEQTCEVVSGETAVSCDFGALGAGSWQVKAIVEDDLGRPSLTELTTWVAGEDLPAVRGLEQQRVELVPDRKEHSPGQTARVLVRTPFAPAEALVTLRRSGLVEVRRLRIESGTHVLEIPIEERHVPNVHLQVDLVGKAPTDKDAAGAGKAPDVPAFATGTISLPVSTRSRTLDVKVAATPDHAQPGALAAVELAVRDAAGQPVSGAEVTVAIVDEAVLALLGTPLPDPLSTFYAPREPHVFDVHSRHSVVLATREEGGETSASIGGGAANQKGMTLSRAAPASAPVAMEMAMQDSASGGADGAAGPPVALRTDFDPLALWEPAVETDASGRARLSVKLPGNLTRYRVLAVAAAGPRSFGRGDSTLTARLPLSVRPSLPRFLAVGDRFEAPIVVQNQVDRSLRVLVAARAAGARMTGVRGVSVDVPAGDRVEVRLPAEAGSPGPATFQVIAASGDLSDAAQVVLPTYAPATAEAFATYGTLDNGVVVQPLRAPEDALPDQGGLEIAFSSTALNELSDAVLYLERYPYDCTEQLASRVLGLLAIRVAVAALSTQAQPDPARVAGVLAADLAALERRQSDDGGFGLWHRGQEPWPYASVHAMHALALAREEGLAVRQQTLDNGLAYLRGIESRLPKWYGKEATQAIVGYALNVRHRLGDADPARARQLAAELPDLSIEACAFILPVLAADPASAKQAESVRAHVLGRIVEEAGTAIVAISYGDQEYLVFHSDRRDDALVLRALIRDQPGNDVLPKLVRSLLEHRKQGRWENTQENAFVLLALGQYFRTFEKDVPQLTARAWLGERLVASTPFHGRSTVRHETLVPMAVVQQGPALQDVLIGHEGRGRLYYRLGLTYAPKSLHLDASDQGFTVERVYEGVDDVDDVRREGDEWRVRAGARVRSRLVMSTRARRTHVALADPLPAGFEPESGALVTTPTAPPPDADARPSPGWWWGSWFEHQNQRDQRAEAFTSLLPEGVHPYDHVCRATTPGRFVAAPAKAEEMYHPEVFGRSSTDVVVVLAAD